MPWMYPLTIVSLTIGASLSPLLTFGSLFQMKEWRIDRLREHLKIEGWSSLLLRKVN